MPPPQRGSARDTGQYHNSQRRQGQGQEADKQGSWCGLALFLPDCECIAEVPGDECVVLDTCMRMIHIWCTFDETKQPTDSISRAPSSSIPPQSTEFLHGAQPLHALANYLLRLDVHGIEELQSLWKCWFVLLRLFRTSVQAPGTTTRDQQHRDFAQTALTPIWSQALHQLEAATDTVKLKRHHLARTVARALTELLTISEGMEMGETSTGKTSLSRACVYMYIYGTDARLRNLPPHSPCALLS